MLSCRCRSHYVHSCFLDDLLYTGNSCWPFSLEFPPSSCQIYLLLHCLQIQSKNSPFLWCKHLWPLTISIHALLIRHNHVDFCTLKLYYISIILCYYVYWHVISIMLLCLLTCYQTSDLSTLMVFGWSVIHWKLLSDQWLATI